MWYIIITCPDTEHNLFTQDLFVPPYIKDRCSFPPLDLYRDISDCVPLTCCFSLLPLIVDAVSTSPPNSSGFISNSTSSANTALDNYEVEVVEIRVNEGDLDEIIP